MSTLATTILSEAQFSACLEEAASLYANKIAGAVVSVTDAAVAATLEARLPIFGTQLAVATFVQCYATVTTAKAKQEILAVAYPLYMQSAT